jgi:hypothetical protein
MIKYIAVAMIAYMIYAGAFSVSFSGEDVGIGFNPREITNRFVSDISTLIENVE